jgi:glycosyltransferase involved in cell wall biosynthesis
VTRVSIVTPSYNQRRYLGECIESVRREKEGSDVEHLVVDGASTDGTPELLERAALSVDRCWSEPDDGPASALNKGFVRARGDIYTYINADDYLLPGTVVRALKVFSQEPDTDVVYGHGLMVDAEGREICRIYSDRWDLERALYGRCPVVQQGTFFRADAFERAGGFNEANRTCWDGELLVDMAAEGARFRRIDQVLGAFRVHESSITGSGRLEEEYSRDRRRIREKLTGGESRFAVMARRKWHGARRILAEPTLALARARERIRRRMVRSARGI